MRLFIAIKPNNALLEALKAAQEKLRAAGVAGNYTKPQNLHITLAFIGEYPDPARVLRAMREVPFAPFDISLCGTGSFKGVFWAGIKEKGGLASYAERFPADPAKAVAPYLETAIAVRECGLGLNAGHDLNLDNLEYFIRTIPWIDEVSIGHAVISDALYMGLEKTIKAYLSKIKIF